MTMRKKIFFLTILILSASVCFAQELKQIVIPESELDFEANGDFTEVTITKFKGKTEAYDDAIMEIPSEIQGIPVTRIKKFAFNKKNDGDDDANLSRKVNYDRYKGNLPQPKTKIKGLFIPDSITQIEEYAFYGLDTESLHLSSSLIKVGDKAFSCNNALTAITLPAKSSIFGKSVFSYCVRLESVNYEDGIEEIPSAIFKSCGIKKVVLPPTIKTVKKEAFSDCPFESIELNEGLGRIEEYAFRGYSFNSEERNKNTKVYTISLSNLSLPGSLSYIDHDAFFDVIIENIEIPDAFSCLSDRDCTLFDIFNTEPVKNNLTLQKKLKSIKLEEEKRVLRELAKQKEEQEKEEKLKTLLPVLFNELLSYSTFQVDHENIYIYIPLNLKKIANNYILKDENNKEIKIDRKTFLERFNSFTNAEYKLEAYGSDDYLYRKATDEEKAEYIERKRLSAFKENKLHTNLSSKSDSNKIAMSSIDKKGLLTVDYVEAGSIFAEKGFLKNDIITAITVTAIDGTTKDVTFMDLLKVQGRSTLTFTIQRGKGKKAETLTLVIPVEWNESELQKLNLL